MADRYDFTANVNTGTNGSGETVATSVTQSNVSMGVSVSASVSAGAKGEQGDKGEKGDPGTGVNIVGSVDDPSQLPPTADVGDCYLINGDLWLYDNSTWTNVGNIQGPKGDDGTPIEVQKSATHLQWRYVGGSTWTDIISLADIKGAKGDTGSTGPANSLSIGTVTSGASAEATITGTAPSQTLSLVIPKGDKGDQGATGNPGEAATIAIGNVTTGAAGTNATVNNSGTAQQAILDFAIPRGNTGAAGTNGKTILSGTGVPAAGLGVAGDFYIDISNWTIYGPKTTTWGSPSSLVGPAGSGAGDMLKSENLSGLADYTVARTNLGLGNVNNTSDLGKPVSTATQTALDAKISGLASSSDNAIVRFDGTTGKAIQSSTVTVSDDGNILTSGLLESSFLAASPNIAVNEIMEYYTDAGVLIDGLYIEDGTADGRDLSVDGAKLDGIEAGAQVNSVTSVNTRTGAVTVNEVPSGGSNNQVLKIVGGVPTWSTDANTTYAEITEAEIATGTASTARAVSARRLRYERNNIMDLVYPVNSTYESSTNSLPASISAIGTWSQIESETRSATSITAQGPAGFSTPFTVPATPIYKWRRTA